MLSKPIYKTLKSLKVIPTAHEVLQVELCKNLAKNQTFIADSAGQSIIIVVLVKQIAILVPSEAFEITEVSRLCSHWSKKISSYKKK